ncbi:MAG: 4-(cytidine 5'-diphospho)-2-C-methyl-D-erythritol kinase [Ruminococcaceae bacterium]|nr:4-(cytidine 5'-diphospho)-2-C-methyl-D-erythritol kinase [Oscillospiraceae bacterium]
MNITRVRLNAAAKINLTLDITGVREDGYHTLESIMQTISMYDTVDIKATDTGNIDLHVNVPFIPTDNRNTCHKAVTMYFDACGKNIPGVEIRIDKTIPSSAGMGGGSADAAAVLRGLEYIYGKCPVDIYEIAAKIGADVPFCLAGGTRMCRGIGEIMTPVQVHKSLFSKLHIVAAKNARGLSTPYMFSQFDKSPAQTIKRPDNEKMLWALKSGNVKETADNLCNVFQDIAIPERPDIATLIGNIKECGALNAVMTGSGAAVFGVFDNFSAAMRCIGKLRRENVFAEYAKFIKPTR